jgi:sialidase-1
VVERASGRVVLVFTRNNEQALVSTSDDDGLSWSAPRDLTADVRPEHWLRYWTGPGHGIQLRHGPHAGRLVVPSYHLEPHRAGGHDICRSHMVYSDDGGATWLVGKGTQLGPEIDEVAFEAGWWPKGFVWSGCECQAAELHDGELYLTVRNQVRFRERKAWARSRDGGQSWTPLALQSELPGLKCQSSVLLLAEGSEAQPDRLLFAGIADSGEAGRRDLTLFESPDGGRTWPRSRLLHAGPSAYSDLCQLSDGRVLCAYEGGAQHAYEGIEAVIIEPALW